MSSRPNSLKFRDPRRHSLRHLCLNYTDEWELATFQNLTDNNYKVYPESVLSQNIESEAPSNVYSCPFSNTLIFFPEIKTLSRISRAHRKHVTETFFLKSNRHWNWGWKYHGKSTWADPIPILIVGKHLSLSLSLSLSFLSLLSHTHLNTHTQPPSRHSKLQRFQLPPLHC